MTESERIAAKDARIAELEAKLAELGPLANELNRIASRIPELEMVDAAKNSRISLLEDLLREARAWLPGGEISAERLAERIDSALSDKGEGK